MQARVATLGVATAIGIGLLAPATPAMADAGISAFDAVDQFIGTGFDKEDGGKGNDAYGNTFPGATVPFGMVQSSPTTYDTETEENFGGYEYSADEIRGFGMTRLSGTGCRGRFGGFDFPIMPYAQGEASETAPAASPRDDITDFYLPFDHANEDSDPGWYSVELDNGVGVELTSTTRTAVSSFTFPDDTQSTLLIDAAGSNNDVSDAGITIDPATSTVTANVTAKIVCAQGPSYTAFMSASFDADFVDFGTWDADGLHDGATTASSSTTKHGSGAWLSFEPGSTVTASIGLSFVSVDGAAANAANEVGDADFATIRERAADSWRDALGTIDITGGTDEHRTEFYTALYHSLLHPNVFEDADGRYTGYDGAVHQVDDGRHFYVNFSSWDTYRSQAQLIALTHPDVASDINQSIVDMVEQTGVWTSWPSYNQTQTKMTGDSLQVVMASTDAFGSTDYDRDAAIESMIASQSLPMSTSNRSDGAQYASLGWIESTKNGAATSRVLEYAVDDFAIAQLAQRLGYDDAYDAFSVRSQSWRNLVNPETQVIDARDRHGFTNTPLNTQGDQFEQSTGKQYGWSVPFNMAALVDARGGVDAGRAALDEVLTELDAGAFSEYAYMSNQPSFGLPWVYNWLQDPAATTDTLYRAHDIMYDATPYGLPGNDDLGSLSSWYVWSNLGIMPAIYGTANLVVSAPMFDYITIASINGDRTIEIAAPGVSDGARYTTGLAVDGAAQSASWIPEEFTQNGGSLEFTMSATPGDWGTGEDDVPPSYDHGSNARNATGITSDGNGAYGSLDMTEHSLSREKLAAEGLAGGETVTVDDVDFTWPDTADGQPDHWIPHGQRIEVEPQRGTGISFLGLATNGPSESTATVVYEDGSTQDVAMQLSDWAASSPQFGNTPVARTSGRNLANGSADTTQTAVFATEVQAIDPEKTVTAIVLPPADYDGIAHVFDVALQNAESADTDPTDPPTDPTDPPTDPENPGDDSGDSGDSGSSDDASSDTGSGALPWTGADIGAALAIALAVIALGAGLMVLRRRIGARR
ncbi:GH92 family glycosyl hydrolase [Microbacterium sp. MPKO10]|uniref:GH92 family glycosyl hydrolase n=1 Tax=Microbacterium sp. MPKO10 TaxID=2989818 RepID=UPI0022363E2E|nr:GH92 family glycosyl hydrolase [Microbacterium sp. MPKO10]MCW4457498.1 GH92 family glycosyl hydrolase [Microbacterium sp. MPKO10]